MIVARIRARSAEAERRWQVRRDVAIPTSASKGEGGYAALVRNLSENGLLIETAAPLGPRDTFEIDLPHHGTCTAEVVWYKGDLKGCRFFTPIPKAVVSAAVLRSPTEGSADEIYEQLYFTRMMLDDVETIHASSALSLPALAFLLVAEVAAFVLLLEMAF